MKRFSACVAAAVAVAAVPLISCSRKQAAPEEKEITLVMAEVNPPETIAGRMDKAFKDKVEELSGGKMKIDLQCWGILGDNRSVREIMLRPNSTIQLTRQGPVAEFSRVYPLFLLPYTFRSREHFWRFAESESARKFLGMPREEGRGVIGLYFGEEGFRHLFSTKRITSAEDFEGLTMRVTADRAIQALADSLKMEKKQVNFADLYSALSTGQVDVADQPLSNYLANHFDEVAPNVVLNAHQLGIMETFITVEAWDSLSEKQREILMEAGRHASEFCRKISREEEEETLRQIEEKGVAVLRVDDDGPWKRGLEDFIRESAAGDIGLYNEIMSFAEPSDGTFSTDNLTKK